MKRVSYLVALSLLAALILGMIAIVPASAEAPYQDKGGYELDFIFGDCGFDVPGHMVVKINNAVFFDQFGEPHSASSRLGGSTATLTYNDHTMVLHNTENVRVEWITFNDAIYHTTGTVWIGTLPGHGAVFGTIGHQTVLETCDFDEEMNWVCEYTPLHFSGVAFNDLEAVCEYFLTGK